MSAARLLISERGEIRIITYLIKSEGDSRRASRMNLELSRCIELEGELVGWWGKLRANHKLILSASLSQFVWYWSIQIAGSAFFSGDRVMGS
jgi:hypothetical protein